MKYKLKDLVEEVKIEKLIECFRCKKMKLTTEFRKSEKKVLHPYCRACRNKIEAIWREKNLDRRRKKGKEHYALNKVRILARQKKKYDPIKSRARTLAKMIKVGKCILCDNPGIRHHPDYSRPLFVIPLCYSHHKMVHDETITINENFKEILKK